MPPREKKTPYPWTDHDHENNFLPPSRIFFYPNFTTRKIGPLPMDRSSGRPREELFDPPFQIFLVLISPREKIETPQVEKFNK